MHYRFLTNSTWVLWFWRHCSVQESEDWKCWTKARTPRPTYASIVFQIVGPSPKLLAAYICSVRHHPCPRRSKRRRGGIVMRRIGIGRWESRWESEEGDLNCIHSGLKEIMVVLGCLQSIPSLIPTKESPSSSSSSPSSWSRSLGTRREAIVFGTCFVSSFLSFTPAFPSAIAQQEQDQFQQDEERVVHLFQVSSLCLFFSPSPSDI